MDVEEGGSSYVYCFEWCTAMAIIYDYDPSSSTHRLGWDNARMWKYYTEGHLGLR